MNEINRFQLDGYAKEVCNETHSSHNRALLRLNMANFLLKGLEFNDCDDVFLNDEVIPALELTCRALCVSLNETVPRLDPEQKGTSFDRQLRELQQQYAAQGDRLQELHKQIDEVSKNRALLAEAHNNYELAQVDLRQMQIWQSELEKLPACVARVDAIGISIVDQCQHMLSSVDDLLKQSQDERRIWLENNNRISSAVSAAGAAVADIPRLRETEFEANLALKKYDDILRESIERRDGKRND